MNAPTLHRRAIRDYDEIRRMAIEASEREAIQRDPQPPEPCNFCAPEDQGGDRPESWSDSAFFLWSILIALCVASAAEWHHFFGAWVP